MIDKTKSAIYIQGVRQEAQMVELIRNNPFFFTCLGQVYNVDEAQTKKEQFSGKDFYIDTVDSKLGSGRFKVQTKNDQNVLVTPNFMWEHLQIYYNGHAIWGWGHHTDADFLIFTNINVHSKIVIIAPYNEFTARLEHFEKQGKVKEWAGEFETNEGQVMYLKLINRNYCEGLYYIYDLNDLTKGGPEMVVL